MAVPSTEEPDMAGKTVLITGGNVGIGKETALALAKMGAHVIIVSRNEAKGKAAQAEIRQKSGNSQVDLLVADLSSQAQVRQLAQTVLERYPRLDVLINNAGGVFTPRQETEDGLELTFATNHLAPFLLTNLLLERLKESAPARIISVSSAAHVGAKIDFDDLHGTQRYAGFRAYGQSKLANILFTRELAERLAGTGVTANAVHPGVVASNFGQSTTGPLAVPLKLFYTLGKRFMLTSAEGAQTSIYLASSPDVANISGEYFVKKSITQPAKAARDEATQKRLWQVSEELTQSMASSASSTSQV